MLQSELQGVELWIINTDSQVKAALLVLGGQSAALRAFPLYSLCKVELELSLRAGPGKLTSGIEEQDSDRSKADKGFGSWRQPSDWQRKPHHMGSHPVES